MIRSFPRTRESRATYAGPSMSPWVPAFAGTSGIDVDSIPPRLALALGARGLVERGAQAARELDRVIVGPEVHEDQPLLPTCAFNSAGYTRDRWRAGGARG